MDKYKLIDIEVVEFDSTDVITTSGDEEPLYLEPEM